jgi:hypothetical protein
MAGTKLDWKEAGTGARWFVYKPTGLSERGEYLLEISYEFKQGRDIWTIKILNGLYQVERDEINRGKVQVMAESMLRSVLHKLDHVLEALEA